MACIALFFSLVPSAALPQSLSVGGEGDAKASSIYSVQGLRDPVSESVSDTRELSRLPASSSATTSAPRFHDWPPWTSKPCCATARPKAWAVPRWKRQVCTPPVSQVQAQARGCQVQEGDKYRARLRALPDGTQIWNVGANVLAKLVTAVTGLGTQVSCMDAPLPAPPQKLGRRLISRVVAMQAPIPVVVAIDEETESEMDVAKMAAEGGCGVTFGRERDCGPENWTPEACPGS